MEIVGFGLALVGFLVATGVWFRSTKQAEAAAAAQADLSTELASVRSKADSLREQAEVQSERVHQLQAELAAAVARRDEKAMASAMWELELERSYRRWRDVIVPRSARAREEVNAGRQLSFAIGQDVDRLREEVGVSIRFTGELDLVMEPEVALGALRITEELLALAAKEADEVAVVLDQGDEPSISVSLECEGWSDDEEPSRVELAQTVDRMAQKLDGWVRWTRQGEGDVTVLVRLPAPAPEASSVPEVSDALEPSSAPQVPDASEGPGAPEVRADADVVNHDRAVDA